MDLLKLAVAGRAGGKGKETLSKVLTALAQANSTVSYCVCVCVCVRACMRECVRGCVCVCWIQVITYLTIGGEHVDRHVH